MAIAAPARRSDLQTAPRPSRTEPPEPTRPPKRPRDRPRPGGQGRSATASVAAPAPPKRKSGTTKGRKAAASGKGATAARSAAGSAAPARKAPARRKVAPKRRGSGVIPIAANGAVRGAVAVTQLPESGLIHRLTRGRAWIGLLGVLLVGIVALNVVTLSFAASAGKIDQQIQELGKENSMLQNRVAGVYGQKKITNEAKKLGLKPSTTSDPKVLAAQKSDVATAASRLSAAAAGVAASDAEGSTEGEEVATSEGGSGEAGAGGEESASGEAAESEFTPEELEIYEREYAELLASEGAG